MNKSANKFLICCLIILTVFGCAAANKQETIIPLQEIKEENVPNQAPESNVAVKTTLTFNVSSCSWSYEDESGKLHAVSITDRKPRYISAGEVYYIDLTKTEVVFK